MNHLNCLDEQTAWKAAPDLEKWQGMEVRAPEQLEGASRG